MLQIIIHCYGSRNGHIGLQSAREKFLEPNHFAADSAYPVALSLLEIPR